MKIYNTHIFSTILTALLMIAFIENAMAYEGRKPSKKKKEAEAINFTFQLKSPSGRFGGVDSALIILDKFDLTGAGVVMKVVAVDSTHQLNLTEVPPGKYYADIYTYGLCRQYIPVVITVTGNSKKQKTNSTNITIADADSYVRGQAVIPPEDLRRFSYVKF